MVDGLNNTVVESDITPFPNAPQAPRRTFQATHSSSRTKWPARARGTTIWAVNADGVSWNPTASRHSSSGAFPPYSIGIKGGATRLLKREDSWVSRRAAFAKKSLWAVKEVGTAKGERSDLLVSTCRRPNMTRRTPWLVGRKAPIA